MIKFENNVVNEWTDKYTNEHNISYSGDLLYKNYPVNLPGIDKEYVKDTLIESFKPFLQIQRPIELDPNFESFTIISSKYYFSLSFRIFFPDYFPGIPEKYIHITLVSGDLMLLEDESDAKIEYHTYHENTYLTMVSGKRSREEVVDEDFLHNVLNTMVRFLNTIIKDYSKIVMTPRLILDRFLGPVEQNLAQFLGTTVLRYKKSDKKKEVEDEIFNDIF